MPRPCVVEGHARGYKMSKGFLRMPRPCAVGGSRFMLKLKRDKSIKRETPRRKAVASQRGRLRPF